MDASRSSRPMSWRRPPCVLSARLLPARPDDHRATRHGRVRIPDRRANSPRCRTRSCPSRTPTRHPALADLPSGVAINRAFEAGAHIRRAGSDLRAGQRLIDKGTELNAAAIALVAAAATGRVSVHRRPRVALSPQATSSWWPDIATRRRPDPGQQLAPVFWAAARDGRR